MTKASVAIFPGSFDPFTRGHADISRRAIGIFDRLVIGVLHNPEKRTLFSLDERVQLIRQDLEDCADKVEVRSFSGLLVDFAERMKAEVIIRGLRAISDYDYETQMALMNRQLSSKVETVFLITGQEYSYVSSSLVKSVALLGGDVSKLVAPAIALALKDKLRQSK